MGATEWGLLVLLSVVWGGSFFFGKLALAELSPFSVVLGRVSIAALVLNILVVVTGNRISVSRNAWAAFVLMGLLNNLIPFSLIFWGQTKISSGLAATLNSTTPLFTVVLAHFLTRDEKVTPGRLIGVLLGVVGVAWTIGQEALAGLGTNQIAQFAVLGAAVSYALAGIFGRTLRSHSPIVAATGQVTTTTAMMVPIVCYVDQPWRTPIPSPLTIVSIVALGVLCTALAYVIYFRILRVAGATNLLLVTLLVPVSASLLGVCILGERVEANQLTGMALIGLGLSAIDGRVFKFIRCRFGSIGSASKDHQRD